MISDENITLIEMMIHNGYMDPMQGLYSGRSDFDVLQDFFAEHPGQRFTVTMRDGDQHIGSLATEGPLAVPGFLAMITDQGVVLIACGIDSSWRTTNGINPSIESIEYEGYQNGARQSSVESIRQDQEEDQK